MYMYMKVNVLVTLLCLILWDPTDCSPPDSSVHGILQERILEWVSHSLLQGICPTQGLNLGCAHRVEVSGKTRNHC